MYKEYIIKTLALALALIFLVAAVMVQATKTIGTKDSASGTAYYVDSLKGNDGKDGKSPTKAWKTLKKVNSITYKPGDKILFKAGCSWNGSLSPSGSGMLSNGIVIDMYGKGKRPLIHGDGSINSAVMLKNQSYWEINNLEITNSSRTWR